MNGVEWPKVFIIILNWNGWKDTIECLESLDNISYRNYDVIIVDNNSQDDSLAKIRAYLGKETVASTSPASGRRIESRLVTNYTRREAEGIQLDTLSKNLASESHENVSNRSFTIIQNERNFGYPEGNNIGMRYALKGSADYVLLLNNDTIVDKYFLTELVRTADMDVSIGVIGPKVYWYDVPNIIQSTGACIDFWKGRVISLNKGKRDDEIKHCTSGKLVPADFMPGACFLIKRKVIEEVGALDPTYFLYGEELDWCVRITRAGYKVVCDLDSKIWHKKAASSSKEKQLAEYYDHRNWVINARKYARLPQFISFFLWYPTYWIAILLKARQFGNIKCFVRGFFDGLLTPIAPQPAFYESKPA